MIETTDDSASLLKQYVWGLGYIDELAQLKSFSKATDTAPAGREEASVLQMLGISEQTYYRRKNKCGGMKAEEAKRLADGGGERAAEEAGGGPVAGQADPHRGVGRRKKPLSPARRREILPELQRRLDCSHRRARQATGTVRSTQRYASVRDDRDRGLITAIYAKVAPYPRYGYRMITGELRIDGWRVNAKRAYRLWRREGLKVARRARKQRAKGGSANSCLNRPSRYTDDRHPLNPLLRGSYPNVR